MINTKCIESLGSRSSKADIVRLEKELGYHFPQDYYTFLLEYGDGGVILSHCVVVDTYEGIDVLNGLEHIRGALTWIKDLELDTDNVDVVSDKMVPVAKTVTNKFYCIYKNTLDTTVYRVNFEMIEMKGFIIPVAKSFADLLDKLVYED
jgi:hypothetical protein